MVERRVFLGRSVICAVSQPGHIAVGGISTSSPQRHEIRNNRTMRALSNVHKDEQGRNHMRRRKPQLHTRTSSHRGPQTC